MNANNVKHMKTALMSKNPPHNRELAARTYESTKVPSVRASFEHLTFVTGKPNIKHVNFSRMTNAV